MGKINIEEVWNSEFFQKHLAGGREAVLENAELELFCNVESTLRDVESPLEAVFAMWWHVIYKVHHCTAIWPHAQHEVEINGQSYRLDFALQAMSPGFYDILKGHPLHPKIAIELDGHDFHERTKSQVEWRNRRDRALVSAGWTVWHFSGSEFHRQPLHVVLEEIYEPAATIFSAAYQVLRREWSSDRALFQEQGAAHA